MRLPVMESDPHVGREKTTAIAGRAARAASGSSAELGSLLERVMPRVFKFFYRRVYDTSVAEDLASQTLGAVLEALRRGSYDARGP